MVRTKYYFTKVRKGGFSYRKSWYFLLGFSKSLTNHSHLRTRPRYLWDNSMGKNSNTIGWLLEELSCKRPDGRSHWPILECTHFFEYTKTCYFSRKMSSFLHFWGFSLFWVEWHQLIYHSDIIYFGHHSISFFLSFWDNWCFLRKSSLGDRFIMIENSTIKGNRCGRKHQLSQNERKNEIEWWPK